MKNRFQMDLQTKFTFHKNENLKIALDNIKRHPMLKNFLNDFANDKIKNYTEQKWEKILNYLKEHVDIAKIILCNKQIPPNHFIEISIQTKNFDYIFQREDLTKEDYIRLLNASNNKTIVKILESMDKIPRNALEVFLDMTKEELAKYNYLPLKMNIRNLSPEYKEIIENFQQKYGENENITTMIANNKYLNYKIRDKAFDTGYVPYNIKSLTPHMALVLYASTADVIFDDLVDATTHQNAETVMNELINNQFLTCSCQLDIIERYKTNPSFDSYLILNKLATETRDDCTICELCKVDQTRIQKIAKNNENKGELTLKYLLGKTTDRQTKLNLILHYLLNERPFPTEPVYINTALNLCSNEINKAMIIKFKENPTIYQQLKDKLYHKHKFYFDFIDELYYKNNDEIDIDKKYYATTQFLRLNIEETKIPKNIAKIDDLYKMRESEYEALIKIIQKLEDQYTDELNASETVDYKLKDNLAEATKLKKVLTSKYNHLELQRKYPHLFLTTRDNKYCLDFEKLLELPKSTLNEYQEKLVQENHPDAFLDIVNSMIEQTYKLCNNNSDKLYYLLTKFNDFYSGMVEKTIKHKEKEDCYCK